MSYEIIKLTPFPSKAAPRNLPDAKHVYTRSLLLPMNSGAIIQTSKKNASGLWEYKFCELRSMRSARNSRHEFMICLSYTCSFSPIIYRPKRLPLEKPPVHKLMQLGGLVSLGAAGQALRPKNLKNICIYT